MIPFILASLVGLSLGLLGSGGSILAVPILKYTAHLPAKEAVATSLATVGAVSLVGTIMAAREKRVLWKEGMIFAAVATLGTYLGVRAASFLTDRAQMGIFVAVMAYAVVRMFREGEKESNGEPPKIGIPGSVMRALAVGVLTGIVGVGGGFLIVPALVALFHLPMKKSTGTSLLVISVNSVVGTIGYSQAVELDWSFTAGFVLSAVIGLVLGMAWSKRISDTGLRKGFAYLLAVVCVYTAIREFF